MSVRSLVLAGAVLGSALLLTACGAPGGGTGGNPGGSGGSEDGPVLTIEDLRGIVQGDDGLASLDFEASEVTATAAEDAESMSGFWDESAGEPAECYAAFASPFLVDDGAEGGDDDTMEIGVFSEPGADDLGLVIVNGRIFDDTATAAAYLDSVRDAVDACSEGYTLSTGGDVLYESGGTELAELTGSPEGVSTLTATDAPGGGDGLRTVYLQRGNAVVAVYAEAYEGGTFTIDDVDEVSLAVAERLADL